MRKVQEPRLFRLVLFLLICRVHVVEFGSENGLNESMCPEQRASECHSWRLGPFIYIHSLSEHILSTMLGQEELRMFYPTSMIDAAISNKRNGV